MERMGGSDFVERINRALAECKARDPRVRLVELAIPVDWVLIGPCTYFEEGNPVDAFAALPDTEGTVVIISACCGQYMQREREGIRRVLTGAGDIRFPPHVDLHNETGFVGENAAYAEAIASDMVDAGIFRLSRD